MGTLTYHVIPCTAEHIAVLAQHLPEIQRREIAVWTDIDVYSALYWSWQRSCVSYAVFFDDILVAGYGADPQGEAWFVTTDEFKRAQPLNMIRVARQVLHLFSIEVGHFLQARVPEFYPESIRLLRLLGFQNAGLMTTDSGVVCQMLEYWSD